MSLDLVCLGRVKWFDNKRGYGIIHILDGEVQGTDVFAHHASIVTGEEQYRYLVSGEYVSCGVVGSINKTIQFAATNIKGVLGGPLMCETIREQRTAKDAYEKEAKQETSRGNGDSAKPLAKEPKEKEPKEKGPKEKEPKEKEPKEKGPKESANDWSKVAKKGGDSSLKKK